jgi:hypothetical protein
MRLPRAAHASQPWRIHELAGDFRTWDVWSYRTPGAGRDDFPVMLAAIRAASAHAQPAAVRLLMGARWKLGALLGWDSPQTGLGARVASLRDRLPPDLRQAAAGPDAGPGPFTPLYQLSNEAARELANKTVHAVMHLGWVPAGDGGYELRMAVLVKPNGVPGWLYLAAIAPFRYLIVYPALTRQWERAWRDRALLLPEGTSPLA